MGSSKGRKKKGMKGLSTQPQPPWNKEEGERGRSLELPFPPHIDNCPPLGQPRFGATISPF